MQKETVMIAIIYHGEPRPPQGGRNGPVDHFER
jgi:hypothetical protein